MKTADDFVRIASCCRFCKHSRTVQAMFGADHYYCDAGSDCPYKTQEEWDKHADDDYAPYSKIAKWLGCYRDKNPVPEASPRYVGFGKGICNKYEKKES